MIIEYFRPQTVEAALDLLVRTEPTSIPIGGGTAIDRSAKEPHAVVDLQELGLNQIKDRGNLLEVGATVTLQHLLEFSSIPSSLETVIQYEATYNLRQAGTVAGTLVASNGRSPFTTALLAMDVQLVMLPGENQVVSLGNLLPVRSEMLRGRLITILRLPKEINLTFEYVARSPADQPIVCVAVCQWSSGRTRVALGGYGEAPILAFDGTESRGVEVAVQNAYIHADDEWASAEYRREIASTFTRRCLSRLETNA